MNDDIVFERNAQAWLEVGPAAAPDRVVRAALDTIAATPQQRDLWAPWRFPTLKLSLRLATASVVAVLVVAAGFLLVRNQQSTVGGPSPTPVPTPSPSVQAALQATWASVSTPPGNEGLHKNYVFTFDPAILTMQEPHIDVANSWSLSDDGSELLLNLQSTFDAVIVHSQRWDCFVGEIGVYSFTFSGGDDTLGLHPVNDPCSPRAAILDGEWSRTPCHNWDREICLGPLSEGKHVAPYFKPFDGGTQGQLAYTVPAGWAEMYVPPTWTQNEVPTQMSLWRHSALGQATVDVYANVAPSSAVAIRDSPPIVCPQAVSTSAQSVTEIAGWLAARPYLSVTSPAPVSIGGLSGVFVDVSVVPGWVDPCKFSEESDGTRRYDPYVSVFESTHDQGRVDLETGSGRARYILLDRGSGQALLIAINGRAGLYWESLLADSMAVVQSFELSH
jgi:hypothetical protein